MGSSAGQKKAAKAAHEGQGGEKSNCRGALALRRDPYGGPMRNALAAALGVLMAAFLAPWGQSQAASGDPSGFWYKPDAERESKIQVFKCGKDKLCAKIVWLKNPNDSRGS